MHFKGILDSNMDIRTALFLKDQSALTPMKGMFEQHGFNVVQEVATQGGSNFLHKANVSDFDSLQAVVLDLAGQEDPVEFAREICARCPANAEVIAIGTQNDLNFYRRLRAVGVSDYFVVPVPTDELVHCMLTLLHIESGDKGHDGRMIVVDGAHGGVGAGLLTAGLGMLLSQQHGRKTVVLDGDMVSPSVGTYLGCDKPGNLKVLLGAEERLDTTLVRQAVLNPLPQLSLLDGWEGLGTAQAGDVDQVTTLRSLLGAEFRYQIWRSTGSGSLRAPLLESADVVLVAVSGTLACARAAQATLKWLNEYNRTARVITVYNNVSPSPMIPLASIEGVLGCRIDYEIPFHKKLGDDLLQGTSFATAGHSLNKDFTRICNDLLGVSCGSCDSWWKRIVK